jgi:malate dehydrogenase (oxaloacetate-decarboxylating)
MSENLYRFKYDEYGNTREIVVYASGTSARSCSYVNKGTAFSSDERAMLTLDASLPPAVRGLEAQIKMSQFKLLEKGDDIEKFIFIRSLFDRNVTLAHALIKSDIENYIKIIYTPTIGHAVQRFSSMFRQANGLHFHPGNIDRAEDILRRYLHRDIRIAVVTDNHGILGLGDQGAGGIAVCLGKLMLYTQGAGIAPWHCLPISLDVGTNNEKLLEDEHYLGWRHKRLEGEEYLSFIGRFVRAFRNVFPNALCQWEDFNPTNAFSIREAFHDEIISFNDDIEGTGAITLAAIFSAMRIKEQRLVDQKFLIHGGGAGGIGIAEQLVRSLVEEGMSELEACSRIFIIDAKGLITDDSPTSHYKKKFAKSVAAAEWMEGLDPDDIPKIISSAGITVLIGTTGQDYFFNQATITELQKNTQRPVILPLFQHVSAPMEFCENVEKYSSQGMLLATGNPCMTMEKLESQHGISQCNNVLIFPGIALGTLVSGAQKVLPEFFSVGAKAIAREMEEAQLRKGSLMPPVKNLRRIAKRVALEVACCAVEKGVSRPCVYSDYQHHDDPVRLAKLIDRIRWKPEYLPLVPM